MSSGVCALHCEACMVIDLFPPLYVSIDQAAGVTPQYPEDPYYQHADQGKRNPPSEHILSYVSATIFSTIILHAVPNVNLLGLEYPIVALRFRCQLPVSPPIIHRIVLLA